MRILVHISDMHFGKFDTSCVEPMLKAIRAVDPNLVVITGDFTQRARVQEYKEAAAFIKGLEHPHVVIPGNHDIRPLYSPISRIADAFDRYKKYINEVLEPGYIDDEIAIASVNTVRAHAIKDGRVSKKQVDNLAKWFKRIDDKKIKIVITHHPFDMPMTYETIDKKYVYTDFHLARKAKYAVNELSKVGVDMYLSGHYHQSSAGETAERYKIDNYSAISVRAGTVSLRQRGEQQSFNLIFIENPVIRIDTYVFNADTKQFELVTSKVFTQTGKGRTWVEDKSLVKKA